MWLSQGTKKIRMGNKEQGRARTGGDVEEERVGGRGHVLPEEGEPQTHLQERTAQDRARPTGGAATAAQEGEGLQSVDGRVCHHTTQTGRILGPHVEVEGRRRRRRNFI